MITIDLLPKVPRAHQRFWVRQVRPLLVTLGVSVLVVTVCLETAVRARWRTVHRLTTEWNLLQEHTAQLSRLERQAGRLAERLAQMESLLRSQPHWAPAIAAVQRALPDDVIVQEMRGEASGWLVVSGVGIGQRRHPSLAAADLVDRLQRDPTIVEAGRVVEMEMSRVQGADGSAVVEFVLRWEPPLRS